MDFYEEYIYIYFLIGSTKGPLSMSFHVENSNESEGVDRYLSRAGGITACYAGVANQSVGLNPGSSLIIKLCTDACWMEFLFSQFWSGSGLAITPILVSELVD